MKTLKNLLTKTLALTALAAGVFIAHAVLTGLFLGAPLAMAFLVGFSGVVGVEILKSK